MIEAYPHRANLYRLTLGPLPTTLYMVRIEGPDKTREEYHFAPTADSIEVSATPRYICWALRLGVLSALELSGFGVREREGLVTDMASVISIGSSKLDIYSAFKLRILEFSSVYYLCLDHQLVERAKLSLATVGSSLR